MWLLSFLPDFVIHLILLAGIAGTIAGFVLGFIPFVKTYKLPIQVIGILLLSLGLWLQGGLANEAKWQLRVKEMEAKVAEAEAKSQKVNTVVVEKIVKEKEYIRLQGEKVIQFIDREVKIYDTVCKLGEPAIKAHNMAATNTMSGESSGE